LPPRVPVVAPKKYRRLGFIGSFFTSVNDRFTAEVELREFRLVVGRI